MTTQSKTALIAAMMLGAAGLAAAPQALAKKPEEAAPAAPKLSEAFRKPAAAAQTAITAKNYEAAAAPLAQAEAAAQSDDEKYTVAKLRLVFENGKLQAATGGDARAFAAGRTALLPPLNALIVNPKTPKAELATFLEFRGNMYYDGQKYAEAIADLEAARAAGSANPDVSLQIMKAKGESGDSIGAAAELQAQIARQAAAGQKVPESWYNYVIAKLYKAKKNPDTAQWSQKVVAAYPTAQNWRQWVRVYMETIPTTVKLDKSQRLDLFRLLRVARALADQYDYEEYAQATDDLGLNAETKAVIDEGRASGKIAAGDGLATMLAGSAKTGLSLEKPIEATEKQALAAKTGDLAAQTGDVYLGTGNYAKAIELYKVALSKPFDQPTAAVTKRRYLTSNEVNTHLGIAYALSGNKDMARATFKMVTSSPRADIAGFWMTWLDLGTVG